MVLHDHDFQPTADRPVRGYATVWQRFQCTVCGIAEMNAIEVNGVPKVPYEGVIGEATFRKLFPHGKYNDD